MIIKLTGQVEKKYRNFLVIGTGSLAYQVFVPATILEKVQTGDSVKFWIHQVVRENDISLYGLLNFEDWEVFRLLTSVSGVGPKMALGILSVATSQQISQAVADNKTALFTRVPGIGQKNASRIIIDLKPRLDAVGELDLGQLASSKEHGELVQALGELGYKPSEIAPVVRKIDSALPLEERLRQALKAL